MTHRRPHHGGTARLLAGLRAAAVITTVAVAAGLLAEAGRQAEAEEAQTTYARTAGPAAKLALAGG